MNSCPRGELIALNVHKNVCTVCCLVGLQLPIMVALCLLFCCYGNGSPHLPTTVNDLQPTLLDSGPTQEAGLYALILASCVDRCDLPSDWFYWLHKVPHVEFVSEVIVDSLKLAIDIGSQFPSFSLIFRA